MCGVEWAGKLLLVAMAGCTRPTYFFKRKKVFFFEKKKQKTFYH